MKHLILIGDGMGDTPVPALGNKTPLEAAHKPTIDRLCALAEPLLVRTVPPGYPPGSDVANLSLLGYEPDKCYTGRAPLEAASMGIAIPADGAAFRCNMVTVRYEDSDRLTMLDYSAGHISTAEAAELIAAIQDACGTERLQLHPGVSYRHLLIHHGATPQGLRTVPPHDWMDQDVTEFYQQQLAVPHLAKLLRCAREVLAAHPVNQRRMAAGKKPANGIWLWGEGGRPQMEMLQVRWGLTGSLISAVDLLKGIGVCAGLEAVKVPGATGWLDTNYQGKADAALKALETQDFAVVHVEAPDEAGHQGSPKDKVQAIEDFDSKIVAPIAAEMDRRGQPYRLAVAMDHYTPIARRTHEDWPVPVFIYDSRGTGKRSGLSYTEAKIKAAAEELGSGAAFFARLVEQERRHG
ncbi:cofactor-independent phosphoglycerate mutase [Candidatus Electronema sp. JM]|uniref:cofactor-independent phosphoglycerate mutase n=1 Tax=Candidatus Electronema sp. JM TaxID=3401571 RepID=UPI003AA93827